jgi:hypothetical protein
MDTFFEMIWTRAATARRFVLEVADSKVSWAARVFAIELPPVTVPATQATHPSAALGTMECAVWVHSVPSRRLHCGDSGGSATVAHVAGLTCLRI